MDIVSVGPVAGGPSALEREMRAVATRLAGSKLAILYLPYDADHGAYLRAADRTTPTTIAVAPIPDEGLGEAINDRLRRAAGFVG